jgi:membrane protease YdiL (CAAX protease family)
MDDEELEPRRGRKMSFLGAALWSLSVGFAASLLVAMTESFRPGAMADVVNITMCKVVAYSVFLFVMLRVYTPQASIRDVLAIRPVSPVASFFALAGGAALYPGLSFIDDAIYKRFPLGQEDTELLDQITQVTSLRERVILLVAFAFVIPVADEVFFNGVLFRGLRRGQAEGLAIVGVAALWAISRGDYRSVPTGLILGLFTTWLRGRSGSLVPGVLGHVAMNAVPLVPIALGKGDFDFGWKLAVGGVVSAAACAWAAGLVLRADDRAEEGRLLDT